MTILPRLWARSISAKANRAEVVGSFSFAAAAFEPESLPLAEVNHFGAKLDARRFTNGFLNVFND